ncbi:MAG: MarR family transcriptional regulator [Arachnia sp.]
MENGRGTRRGPLHALQSFTVEAERYMEVTRRMAGLGHNDVHALSAVVEAADRGEILTPGALRRRLILSPAATTALVDRLVGHGLIRRERMTTDGRTVALLATDKARHIGRDMFVVLSDSIMERLNNYPADELERFVATIHDLTEAARRAREQLECAAAPAPVELRDVVGTP